ALCGILSIRPFTAGIDDDPEHHTPYTMRKLLLCLIAILPVAATAQPYISTFDTPPLQLPKADTFYVNYSNPGGDVGFDDTAGRMYFPCVYDTAFGGLWSTGFAYSNMTDSVTSGFGNMYSAKAAKG